jgi:hypothetical protein
LTVVAYVDPQAGDRLFGCQGVKVGEEGKTGCWYIFKTIQNPTAGLLALTEVSSNLKALNYELLYI